ncbi:DHHC zinc finger domain containing protein [Entamoeba histolytica HM-1:IMSS-B]|uniref:Palmitoyltransferase n=6 Tax=Entamoeba histolytica TaxID=5759 RepID=C4LT07_ENTH1|nr:DHHC zinc finger domain-containing protein [Entamoeba histolytica HM-1:IMSS]EMD42836.1 DHHC zinc finger domain containing protein [Entamoeba histolytica KU27]EMH72222.1 DHHC zinc finger domain containing protein [Entamoeba histolytica HM-1:IMSS-B]EMS16866.1 DHHC zinc finger domain containing protein [Entamoeba histolytica HM-3:IMSS]ENY59747.1 DHHC zinc finger domain containing protein [Entamoeba histolytica HM-1:IMSS-A]GAT91675.1 hypothetical protein conserved domain containing [Entamoeba h|eukprot:XP_657503.1 DHHC zinc finger domain-containing protein [Entamoeba histolytica HM-1:IMSS]
MGSDFIPKHFQYKKYRFLAVSFTTLIFFTTISLFCSEEILCIINNSYCFLVFYFFLYVPNIVLTIWSYYRTVFTDVWLPNDIDTNTDFKICKRCHHRKPIRCHHCSQCQACVLKMDHHCPWLGTCVGFKNHKFFILFLCYAGLTCCIVTVFSTLFSVLDYLQNKSFTVSGTIHLVHLLVGIAFGLSAFSMITVQIPIALTNSTTIERDYFSCCSTKQTRQDNPYDLGNIKNLQLMFGTNILTALLPIYTTQGDGMHWELNSECFDEEEQKLVKQNSKEENSE